MRDPTSGTSLIDKWGFRVAMLPVGALYFYRASLVRIVLPK